MKTIIQFIHELGDGGGSSIVKDYALCLNNDGYRVVVLVVFPEPSSVNYKIIKKNGIDIQHVFESKSFFNRLKNKISPVFFISRKVRQLVREYKPISLHCHLQVLTYLKKCSNDLKGVNLFYTYHSLPDKFFTGRYSSEFSAAKYLIIHNDLQLIALHQGMANKLNSMFDIHNTVIVNNGIVLDRFLMANIDKKQRKKELGIPQDAFVVGHIGRFNEVKNHKHLIKVFKSVSDIKKNAFLLLVGTGELRGDIERWVEENGLRNRVLILTHRTDIPELLKLMDVFCFPSLYEGLGIVVIEAQAARCRCVVSNVIPDEAIVSNIVTKVALNAPIEEWRDAIMKEKTVDYVADFSSFDIARNVKIVEKLYNKN